MDACCKRQSARHCPECGANLKANTLLELKEYLEERLKVAAEMLSEWTNTKPTNPPTETIVKLSIACNLRNVEQLKDWIAALTEVLRQPEIKD